MNFKKLQYKRFKAKKSEISCSIKKESKTYFLGGYSAQAIKECIDYDLKSANNPYVLTNFCQLLSLTCYSKLQ